MRRLFCGLRGHVKWWTRMGVDYIASPPANVYAVRCHCGSEMYLTDKKEDQ